MAPFKSVRSCYNGATDYRSLGGGTVIRDIAGAAIHWPRFSVYGIHPDFTGPGRCGVYVKCCVDEEANRGEKAISGGFGGSLRGRSADHPGSGCRWLPAFRGGELILVGGDSRLVPGAAAADGGIAGGRAGAGGPRGAGSRRMAGQAIGAGGALRGGAGRGVGGVGEGDLAEWRGRVMGAKESLGGEPARAPRGPIGLHPARPR